MFTLRIFIYGLTIFVPGNQSQNCDHVTVILPDARAGYVATDGNYVEGHTPCLQWREPFDVCESGNGLKLNRDRIGFTFFDASGNLIRQASGNLSCIAGRDPQNRNKPSNATEGVDFSWTPRINEILGRASPMRIDPLCMDPQNPAGIVVASGRFERGVIQTCSLIEFDDSMSDIPRTFNFRPLRSVMHNLNQALAEVTLLTIEAPGNAVGISVHLEPFIVPGGDLRGQILFPLDCGDDFKCIDLFIWNMPPKCDAAQQCREEGIGRHFEIYYHLLEQRPPLGELPVPDVVRANEDVFRSKCEGGPGGGALPSLAKQYFETLLTQVTDSLESRPICPMVQTSE